MKLLWILLLSSSLFASSAIQWYDDFDEASMEAKKTHKPIIVMFTTSWCGVCNMMKEKVFTDQEIIKKQSENFISLMYDKEFDDFPKRFDVFGTPTFYFLDSNAKELDIKIGGSNLMGWNKELDKRLSH